MTVDFRLANVLLDEGDHSVSNPDLYWHRTKVPVRTAEGTCVLGATSSGERYDFATYFNALSTVKWRRYTVVDNVWLHLRAKGDFTLTLVGITENQPFVRVDVGADTDFSLAVEDVDDLGEPGRTRLLKRSFSADGFADVDVEFPSIDDDLVAFELVCTSPVEIAGAYYYTKVDESLIRPVELAVAATTFRKEDYILPNVELLRRQVGECDEPIADHFTLHVVDNGRTLDAEGLSGGCVRVHPNPNVGGSGGFARGMIEAMEQTPRATHVVLLDDDVEVSPESFKRTYNLLSLVKDAYRSAFVSGAMISLEQQNLFHEDIGQVTAEGFYAPAKRAHRLDTLKGVVDVETENLPFADKRERYAGWWFCCVPVECIERHGLPLPLFVRGDDTEYAARCHARIMTMNGISVWHMTFNSKFRASVDRYQVLRNSLIGQATTGVYADHDFVKVVRVLFGYDLKTFYYEGCELTIRAVRDFLRGPEYLKRVDGSALMKENSQKNEKLVRLEDMDPSILKDVVTSREELGDIQRRNLAERAFDYLTLNGHRLPDAVLTDEVGVIPFTGYYPNYIRNRTRLLVVSSDLHEGVYREMDRARSEALEREFESVLAELRREHDRVYAEWAASAAELTSTAFWKDYLRRMAAPEA
ncbi:MAG: glycosyltransferase [Olsenella sp.]|jgi:galactofuranosylgalactofuranosylrhamnosyl-N-acetylglucosaminyl-diphospho-decaprenol beta-1,5/1,6-galactofuranosyltransferase